MSMDDTGRQTNNSVTDSEGLMFAPTPAWERGRKRRGLMGGGKRASSASLAPAHADEAMAVAAPSTVSPEPRSFAAEEPMTLDRPLSTSQPGMYADMQRRPMTDDLPSEDTGMVAPIGRTSAGRTTVKRSGPPVAALAAGVVALGALGAAGWYASQDRSGVPELTPGSEELAAGPAAATPMAPPAAALPAAPAQTAPATPARAAAEPVRSEASTRMASSTPRARPAARAPSAAETGVNASATTALPAGPQPYSTLNPSSSATPSPATTDIPAPAPAQSAPPAPIPDTPPISPAPAETAPAEAVTPSPVEPTTPPQ